MRVSQVSVYSGLNYPRTNVIKNQQMKCELPPKDGIEFKGKFGAWVGGVLSGAAIVVTALTAAPAAICLLGGSAVIGAIGGDAAEDAVNGKKDD